MPRLAHISDLHFGRITKDAAQLLLDDLHAAKPDYVLASGDLTQSARTVEFAEAAAFFAEAPGTLFVVPGNHDIPGWQMLRRMLNPYGRYREHIQMEINPVHVASDIALVGFNTARRVVYHWNWAHGRISRSQFETLHGVANAARDLPKIAMFHHPLIPPPPGASQKRVGRAERFAAALSGAGFHLALSGHLHHSRVTDVSTVYPGVAPGLYAVEAGTATSSRLRNQPNEYNLIDVTTAGADIHVRSFDDGGFATRETISLPYQKK